MTPAILRCDKCSECYHDKSKKYSGSYTWFCKLNGRYVGQSRFGMNSPRGCPKRTMTANIDIEKTEAEELAEREYLRRVRAERKGATADDVREPGRVRELH